MNEENLDEFEDMGIPIDDLAAQSPCPSSSEESQSDSDQASDTPSLPELFDEDELAEVGLVAGDGGTFNDAPEGALPAAEPSASTEDDVPLDSQNETPLPDAIAEPEIARDEETPLEPIWPSTDESEHSAAELTDETGPALQDADVAAEIAPELPFEEPDLIERIHQIGLQMTALQREFEGKLKYDAHKDEIIDKLHNELQEYKQDILKKHILSIVMDVVKVADDIRKWLTYFRSLEVSQRDPRKLFRYLEAIPSDLEDIFYWHGVRPFSTAEGIFDPTRQRAIKKVPSMDASQDKLIAESIRPGYEWDGKVIRQEMVAVYVYQEEQESSTMGMNNE